MQIDLNKKYKTSSGLEVKELRIIDSTAIKFPVRGTVLDPSAPGGKLECSWTLDGRYSGAGTDARDLVEAPERIRKPEPKWEVGPVKLVNGLDAVIHRFCEKRQRYIGEWQNKKFGFYAAEWHICGSHSIAGTGDPMLDLAPPAKRKVQLHKWANVYEDGSIFPYPTKKEANDSAGAGRFALIEIDREVEEGEGLDLQTEHDANSTCNK